MPTFTTFFILFVAFLGIYYEPVTAIVFSHVESSGQQSIIKQFEIPPWELKGDQNSAETELCRAVPTSLPVTNVELLSEVFSHVESIEIFSCNIITSEEVLFCDSHFDVELLCPGYKLQQLYTPGSLASIGGYPYPTGGLLLRVKYLNNGQMPPIRISLTEQDSGSSMNIFKDHSFLYPDKDFFWQHLNEMPQDISRDQEWKLSWDHGNIGTVSGIAVLNEEFLYVFHRVGRNWDGDTFSSDFKIKNTTRLVQDTILKCHIFDGVCIESFGSNMFLMPHGISVTPDKNLLVTDTGRHQVFMLDKEGKIMLELGEDRNPGNDASHFCQPADAEIDPVSDLIFVADGYCNQRVAVFDQNGKFQTSIKDCNGKPFQVVHDLAIDSKRRILFVADRENDEVCMYSLHENTFGQFIDGFSLDSTSVYALDYNPGYLYAVGVNRILDEASGFIFTVESNLETNEESKFTDFSMKMPHDVSVLENQIIFVSDLNSPLGVLKFRIGFDFF